MFNTGVRGLLAIVALLLAFGFGVPSGVLQDDRVSAQPSKPNIIFVMADDLDERTMQRLPGLRSMMASKGVSFENAFVTHSLCCPSRASVLTGRYTRNHGVLTNQNPHGGVEAFEREGNNRSNVARWLSGAGYETVFIGKYLNGYKGGHVPPGWNRWYGYVGAYNDRQHRIYIGDRGSGMMRRYDPTEHHDTDLFRKFALEEIRRSARNHKPLFLNLWLNAPHTPPLSPPRHRHAFKDEPLPKPPSFNEEDVSDKPSWVREKAPFSATEEARATSVHRSRLRSMLSVKDLLLQTLRTLRDTGQLSNTYIIFTSDNGYHFGEHGMDQGKQTAYEEDISVPLYARGPDIPSGKERNQLALNIDLAPTLADLAGVRAPENVDGRSLAPLLKTTPPSGWRSAFLIENYNFGEGRTSHIPAYKAVRTQDHIYIEYKTGEKELYDLGEDPYELENLVGIKRDKQAALEDRLEALKGCSSARCRSADGGPS